MKTESFILRRSAAVAFCFAAALAAGCGESSPNRRVTGTITLDGEPVPTGYVSLIPTGKGHSAGGAISDGQYEIEADKGPVPGAYRVRISSKVDSGRTATDPDTGEVEAILKETIPPRYSDRTELTIDVTADGDNVFDFQLRSE